MHESDQGRRRLSRAHPIRRTAVFVGYAVLLIVAALVALLALAVLVVSPTYKRPPSPQYHRPRSVAEANWQDIDDFRRLPQVDRSFTPQTKAAFERALDSLQAQSAQLDRAVLEMGLARTAALAGNGHTNESGVAWGRDLNSVPLRFEWFEEGLFVVQAAPEYADLVGDRVITEERRTPDELAKALGAFVGGPAALKHELAPHFIESPQALHAAGLAQSATQIDLVVLSKDQQRIERVVAARPEPVAGGIYGDEPDGLWPQRDLSPARVPGDARTWRHVLDGTSTLPLYLRSPERYYWATYLNGSEVLYVQLNAVRDQNGSFKNGHPNFLGAARGYKPVVAPPLTTFLDQVVAEAAKRRPRYAIVDLRFNPGGNSDLTNKFSRDLPRALPADGKLFIVTSGDTFSAGIITAARLKYYAGRRAVIVGQRIGDNEQFWAEGFLMQLPNSHITFDTATAYHDWKHGCSWRQIRTCFWLDYFTGVAAGDLSPTLPVQPRYSDYLAGRDTAMEAIWRAMR